MKNLPHPQLVDGRTSDLQRAYSPRTQRSTTAMPKISAGLLLYRRRGAAFEVLLVHPGGPFWAKKDEGAWSIPKGEAALGEERLQAARGRPARAFARGGASGPIGRAGEVAIRLLAGRRN